MKTILVCNSKGGVGKSLVADELAFSFERTNTPMNFFDLDHQGGTLHATQRRPDAVVSVVDTPGALTQQLSGWIRNANVVVIPVRPTSRDIEPFQRMQQAVASSARKGTRVAYILNGWNRFRAASDFHEFLSAQGYAGKIVLLPQSEMFVQAGAAGRSVIDYAPHSPAARATENMCNVIRGFAGV